MRAQLTARALPAHAGGDATLRIEIEEDFVFPAVTPSQSRNATASALLVLESLQKVRDNAKRLEATRAKARCVRCCNRRAAASADLRRGTGRPSSFLLFAVIVLSVGVMLKTLGW
jgi:predicted amidohydrolase